MSRSRTKELLAYRRTRLPWKVFLPLSVFLSTAAQAAASQGTVWDFACNVAIGWMLLFQFRLWDDVHDLKYDRIMHPDRVLSRVSSHGGFKILLLGSMVSNFVMVLWLCRVPVAIVYLVFNLFFLFWYHLLARRCPNKIVNCHVVLLKYPVFVYVLADQPWEDAVSRALYVVLLVYFCFSTYELLHDKAIAPPSKTVAVLGVEMGAMALICVLIIADQYGNGDPILLPVFLALLGFVGLILLFGRHRAQLSLGTWRYVVFIICFAWLLQYSLETQS